MQSAGPGLRSGRVVDLGELMPTILQGRERKKEFSQLIVRSANEGSGCGQLQGDFEAAAFAVGSAEGSVVEGDDAGGNGEAEAGAA